MTPIDVQNGPAGKTVEVLAPAVSVAAGDGSLVGDGHDGPADPRSRRLPGRAPPCGDAAKDGDGRAGPDRGGERSWRRVGGQLRRLDSVPKVSPRGVTVAKTIRVGGDPLSLGVSGGEVYVGDGTAQTIRTVWPTPGSKKLVYRHGPAVLLPVSAGVWGGRLQPRTGAGGSPELTALSPEISPNTRWGVASFRGEEAGDELGL